MKNKICSICGSEFSPKRGNQKYCSADCAYTMKKKQSKEYYDRFKKSPLKVKICPVCNKKFTFKHGKQKYCSEECAQIMLKKQSKEYYDRFRKLPPKDKICPVCKKIFTPKRGNQKYCSEHCGSKVRKKTGSKPNLTENQKFKLTAKQRAQCNRLKELLLQRRLQNHC